MTKYLYRAEPEEAPLFFNDGPETSKWTLYIEAWPIVRETPCFWFISHYGKERKVGKCWAKQWAAETVDGAIADFYHRKAKQIKILEDQLLRAREHAEAVPPELPLVLHHKSYMEPNDA